MGGLIGAVSSKFVLAAGGLLIFSRVDFDRVEAWINPAAPVTEISERLAAKLDKSDVSHPPGSLVQRRHGMMIGIGANEFSVSSLPVTTTTMPNGVDLMFGRDLFTGHIVDLDFRHSEIRLVPSAEYNSNTRHRVAIPLTLDNEGCWMLHVWVKGAGEKSAALDLANPNAVTLFDTVPGAEIAPVTINIGGAAFRKLDVVVKHVNRAPLSFSLGLRAFAGHRVLFDFPHSRIWLDK